MEDWLNHHCWSCDCDDCKAQWQALDDVADVTAEADELDIDGLDGEIDFELDTDASTGPGN